MSKKVVTIDTSSSAFDATREILDRDIGCVLVLKEGQIVGILTKGDILSEVVMKRLDPQRLKVETIMSHPVATIDPKKTLSDASKLMSTEKLTKLPVVNGKGELMGIITSTDIIRRSRPKKLAKDLI